MHIEVEEIRGRHFDHATVPLDGCEFTDCTFTGCVLTYAGGLPFAFFDCTFDKATILKPEGHAANTINALWAAYHHGFRQWPEHVIAVIKQPPTKH